MVLRLGTPARKSTCALRGEAWWKGHRSMSESDARILPIGTIVHSRYQISGVVGRGGLGTVYQVLDVLFSKHNVFALKELLDQSSGARKQFELESQWLQSLDHNNIPKVREHFEWQQRLYLVMDFVEGENLEQKLTRLGGRPLPERQVLEWILPICDALQYLHSRMPPILHRDVKPANIIVTPSGHPVLVDLGIAKEHLPGARMTATFVRKAGTEGYAPPEQYSTAGQTGPWSDVYGLGATLYHLLTGRIPPTAVERVALDNALIRPGVMNPSINPRVDSAIVRALSLRPSERFQSIADFKNALFQAIGISISTSYSYSPFGAPAPALSHSKSAQAQPFDAHNIKPNAQPGIDPSAPYTGIRPGNPANPASPPSLSMLPPDPLSPPHASPASWNTGELSSSQPSGSSKGLPAMASSSPPDMAFVAPAHTRKHITAPPKFLRTPWLALIALCLIMVGAGAAYMVVRAAAPPDRSSASATVKGYFAALHNQDYARAWLFVSASRKDVETQSELASEWQADDARFGAVLNSTIASTENEGPGKVTIQVHVLRAKAPNTVMNYTLVVTQYDGSTWLIDSISLASIRNIAREIMPDAVAAFCPSKAESVVE
jgi:serine/threonine protein kinase, bacterial